MPDTNGTNRKPPDKRNFMREKIVKPPLPRRRLAARLAVLLILAAICGAVAGVSFVLAKGAASRLTGQETPDETTPISFTRDELEPSTEESTEPAGTESVLQDEKWVEEQVAKAIAEHSFSAEDMASMYGALRDLARRADEKIVTVHSEKQRMDWFGNAVENTDQAAGIIIAKTPREILIFTSLASVSDNEAIAVVFNSGDSAPGIIRQTDQIMGVAVISVETSALPAEKVNDLEPVELGNSYSVKQSDLVLAVGSPAGIVHSTNYGNISYVAKNVQTTDGNTRVFYTDMAGNASVGTFIIDLEGKMIGWVTDDFKNENSQDMTAIYSISDYKPQLERLTNGRSIAYFGVRGQEVSAAMIGQGMPAGIYVADAVAGGPAYEAGIQNGDIITAIDGSAVRTSKELQTQLENLESGQEITVKVRRQSREEYKELEYHVNLRAR